MWRDKYRDLKRETDRQKERGSECVPYFIKVNHVFSCACGGVSRLVSDPVAHETEKVCRQCGVH